MPFEKQDSKLGALLKIADIVDDTSIKRGLLLSRYTGLPLGRALVLLGSVSDQLVKDSILMQSLVRDQILPLSAARKALSLLHRQSWSLPEACSALGIDSTIVSNNRLGELLKESYLLNEEELDLALYINEHSNLPLGYVVGLLGRTSASKLKYALNLQRAIRSGRIPRQSAIYGLRTINKRAIVGDYDRNALFKPLASLLVQSGVVQRQEMSRAFQIANSIDRMTALVLIENRFIEKELLLAAIKARELILTGQASESTAAGMISQCARALANEKSHLIVSDDRIKSFQDFLKAMGFLDAEKLSSLMNEIQRRPELSANVVDHLMHTRKIDYNDTSQAIHSAFKNDKFLTAILRNTTTLDQDIVDSAVVFYELYNDGRMRLDQIAVNFTIQSELNRAEIEKSIGEHRIDQNSDSRIDAD